ncbi:hypothetical protein [Lentzea sp. CC55]|nr:hypothetical protein [Lentzea sp. CC55]MCG8923037.1 hypothetical protein [Lentzea sp. CC55]
MSDDAPFEMPRKRPVPGGPAAVAARPEPFGSRGTPTGGQLARSAHG